jgi:hypothetical protein
VLIYYWFVHSGTNAWHDARTLYRFRWAPDEIWRSHARFDGGVLGYHLMKVLAAVLLYLCGRSLWYGGRSARWWVGITIVALPAAVGASFACLLYSGAGIGTLLQHIGLKLPDWCKWLGEFTFPLPWLMILLAAAWRLRPAAKRSPRGRCVWTYFAGIWCAGQAIDALTSGESLLNWELLRALEIRGLPTQWLLLAPLLPIVVALFLWTGYLRPARLLALALGAAAITVSCVEVYGYTLLSCSAIDALFYAHNVPVSHRAALFPLGLVWANESMFLGIFVQPIIEAGPWFLIAWYAWRAPIWVPPEDGSPYPRRYCGRCHYNLHGIDSSRCPECGHELVSP